MHAKQCYPIIFSSNAAVYMCVCACVYGVTNFQKIINNGFLSHAVVFD